MLVEACELLEGWGGCEREGKGAYCLFVLLVVRDDSPFFPALLVRALLNIPSGTTRLRSSSISSIVLSCPSVNFVKYASGKMSVRWRRGGPRSRRRTKMPLLWFFRFSIRRRLRVRWVVTVDGISLLDKLVMLALPNDAVF